MKFAEGEVSVATYPGVASNGGTQAALSNRRLMWRAGTREEHYPIDKIVGVTHGYERSPRHIVWALLLVAAAIALGATLSWAQQTLPAQVDSMVERLADREKPERIAAARRAYQQRVDAVLLLILPLWGVASGLLVYGVWLGYKGALGETRVEIALFGNTRRLSRRGRDPRLLEFGERLAQQFGGGAPTEIRTEPQL